MARYQHATPSSFTGLLIAGIAFVTLTAFWVSNDDQPTGTNGFEVEEFATGFDSPWGMAFLPDGRMLVTEKTGNLRMVSADGTVSEPLGGVPEVCVCGQGGLLDVQIHPEYETNGWIYLAYSDPIVDASGDKKGFTAISRAKLDGMSLVDHEMIYQVDEKFYTGRGQHYGSRIVFDNDGYMFFSVGDRGQRDKGPQFLDQPSGKVHRLYDDGRIPHDNPFVGVEGALPSIWSYGHRNPQGLDYHAETGSLWGAEHGPRGGDELNHIRKGRNFGWPVISYGINYDGTKFTDITEKEGMEQPEHHWTPSIATCGITFYTGNTFPEWKGNIFVSSLKFGRIHRVVLNGTTIEREEIFLETGGRPRDVITGPDGYLYIAIEDAPGRIVRLVPES